MLQKQLLLFAALCVCSVGAFAQIYKCGNIWSQTPCAPDAKLVAPGAPAQTNEADGRRFPPGPGSRTASLPKAPDLPATPQVVEHAKALCESAIREQLKDPESARIRNTRRGEAETHCTTPPTFVRYYWMFVNAKNSYGGYVGEKPYRCDLNIAESAVMRVTQIGPGEALPVRCPGD